MWLDRTKKNGFLGSRGPGGKSPTPVPCASGTVYGLFVVTYRTFCHQVVYCGSKFTRTSNRIGHSPVHILTVGSCLPSVHWRVVPRSRQSILVVEVHALGERIHRQRSTKKYRGLPNRTTNEYIRHLSVETYPLFQTLQTFPWSSFTNSTGKVPPSERCSHIGTPRNRQGSEAREDILYLRQRWSS